MRITIHYLAQLRRLAGRSCETVEAPAGCSLAAVVRQLASERGPDLAAILLAEANQVPRSLLVFVGEDQVRDLENHVLKDSDVVTLLTPMAGG